MGCRQLIPDPQAGTWPSHREGRCARRTGTALERVPNGSPQTPRRWSDGNISKTPWGSLKGLFDESDPGGLPSAKFALLLQAAQDGKRSFERLAGANTD